MDRVSRFTVALAALLLLAVFNPSRVAPNLRTSGRRRSRRPVRGATSGPTR